MSAAAPLDADIAARLAEIGLHQPDPENPLHRRLVAALTRTRGATWGNQLVALKFEFNWEQLEAGRVFARSKVDYEHFIDKETVRLRATPDERGKVPTRAEAEQIARASDRAYELQLQFLLAEKREQGMRKMLDTLSSALENHRTDRADQRAADVEHGRSAT